MANSRDELLNSLEEFSNMTDLMGVDGSAVKEQLTDLQLLQKVRESEAREQRLIELFGSLEVASGFFRRMKGKSKEEVLFNFNALTNAVASQKKEKEAERVKKLRKDAIPAQIILLLFLALIVYILWD